MSTSTTSSHSRREFLRTSAAAFAATACTSQLLGEMIHGSEKKPNIIFFLGEGVRPDESSLSGNQFLHTPNIDRIGREGAVFNNSFVTNALCLPGRASVLSGMYGHTTGAVDNQHSKVPDSFPIVTDLIRNAGYEIAFIGKSHVEGALTDRYWDYYFGFKGQADYEHPMITEGRNGKFSEPVRYNQYVDDILTDRAVNWLKEPHAKPICLFLWFYAPHAPFYRPLRRSTDFNGVSIPIPKSYFEYKDGYPGKPQGVVDALNKIGEQFFGNDDPRSFEELVKDHYAGVESNDDDMEAVFQVLEDKKMMDDTAVLWSSDHGFFLGEHRFYDKRLMYEPSIRVPMMIRYPKRIQPGTTTDEMVLNIDIAPTLLDLAGASIPSAFQGRSLMPLAEGKKVSNWRKDWLYEYYEYPGFENVPPCRGIRTERYKYIDYFTQNAYELYDLQTDPDEMHNLYSDPAHAGLVKQLRTRLTELRKETGDHYVYEPTKLLPGPGNRSQQAQ
ncbi:MAG: sulfatase [Acidobacteriaceae bacterium]|nr:sulfatase [Acidobacteriaceae bacterium]